MECSKLGKTWIITDAKTDGVEMPHFLIRISRCIPSEIEGYDLLFIILLIKSKRGCPISGQPLVLLHLKVINTADQLICDLAELLCTDIHLLEGIHYLFRLIVCLLRAVHIALHDF